MSGTPEDQWLRRADDIEWAGEAAVGGDAPGPDFGPGLRVGHATAWRLMRDLQVSFGGSRKAAAEE